MSELKHKKEEESDIERADNTILSDDSQTLSAWETSIDGEQSTTSSSFPNSIMEPEIFLDSPPEPSSLHAFGVAPFNFETVMFDSDQDGNSTDPNEDAIVDDCDEETKLYPIVVPLWLHHMATSNVDSMQRIGGMYPEVLNIVHPETGYTALHYAAANNSVAAIQLLIDHFGVDVNIRDQSGSTAMHVAVMHSHNDMYDFLSKIKNADPDIRNVLGLCARDYCLSKVNKNKRRLSQILFHPLTPETGSDQVETGSDEIETGASAKKQRKVKIEMDVDGDGRKRTIFSVELGGEEELEPKEGGMLSAIGNFMNNKVQNLLGEKKKNVNKNAGSIYKLLGEIITNRNGMEYSYVITKDENCVTLNSEQEEILMRYFNNFMMYVKSNYHDKYGSDRNIPENRSLDFPSEIGVESESEAND